MLEISEKDVTCSEMEAQLHRRKLGNFIRKTKSVGTLRPKALRLKLLNYSVN